MESLSPNVFGHVVNWMCANAVGSSTHPAVLFSCYDGLHCHFSPLKQFPGMTWDLPWCRDLCCREFWLWLPWFRRFNSAQLAMPHHLDSMTCLQVTVWSAGKKVQCVGDSFGHFIASPWMHENLYLATNRKKFSLGRKIWNEVNLFKCKSRRKITGKKCWSSSYCTKFERSYVPLYFFSAFLATF